MERLTSFRTESEKGVSRFFGFSMELDNGRNDSKTGRMTVTDVSAAERPQSDIVSPMFRTLLVTQVSGQNPPEL